MLNTLNKRLAALAWCALCSPAALAQDAAPAAAPAAPYRQTIGWVSIDRLLSESKMAKDSEAKIEREYAVRDKQIQEQVAEFQRLTAELNQASNWDEARRNKRLLQLNSMDVEIQRKKRNFQEDLIARKNEARTEISTKAYVLVQQSYFISDRIDITDLLLKELDK